MNRYFGLSAALLIAACAPNKMSVDLGDVEDYTEFLEDRADEEALEPFIPEPLLVSATGKVQAQPDIAVITAMISAEDKNESKAVNQMSEIVNAVQKSLSGRDIETGFTGINSQREFDQDCRNANIAAQQRHSQIQSDFWFNRGLDQRGDTETKRRPAKPRLTQKPCHATSIKVSTRMVIRIQPAEAAGDVLRALADAGAENSRLFGYDFTDYDALYQEAAEKAVKQARVKAETVAKLSGADLGEIVNFSVSRPSRTARFGPQPNVIRPARPYAGQSGSVVDRQVNITRRATPPPPQPMPSYSCWDGSLVYNGGMCPSSPVMSNSLSELSGAASSGYTSAQPGEEIVVVQEASTELIVVPATYETVIDNGIARRVVKTSARTMERVVPAVTKTLSQAQAQSTTNALSMSLLSGPQTIAVTANLSYTYETPLNGKVIVEDKT